MNKFNFQISSIFNTPSRHAVERLDRATGALVATGDYEDGDLSATQIDILFEGHLSEIDLKSTKAVGQLFQSGNIAFGEVQPLHQIILQVFTEDQPLISVGLSKSTIFSLVKRVPQGKPKAAPSALRHANSKTDGRPLTFVSLRIPRLERVKESPSFD